MSPNPLRLLGFKIHRGAKGKLENLLAQSEQAALLNFDIDWIRHYSDVYGHSGRDVKAFEIAQEIKTHCGANAHLFRWDGDEYAAILPEVSLDAARQVAESIRAGCPPVLVTIENGQQLPTATLSIGIAHFPTHASNAHSLIEAATSALFKAKQGGKLRDGTPYVGRNCVIAIGDFMDD